MTPCKHDFYAARNLHQKAEFICKSTPAVDIATVVRINKILLKRPNLKNVKNVSITTEVIF